MQKGLLGCSTSSLAHCGHPRKTLWAHRACAYFCYCVEVLCNTRLTPTIIQCSEICDLLPICRLHGRCLTAESGARKPYPHPSTPEEFASGPLLPYFAMQYGFSTLCSVHRVGISVPSMGANNPSHAAPSSTSQTQEGQKSGYARERAYVPPAGPSAESSSTRQLNSATTTASALVPRTASPPSRPG